MSISKDTQQIFEKYISKKNTKKLTEHIINYCNKYSENNNCEYLLQDIINTKISYFSSIFEKNNYLKNSIKNKLIDPSNICYLNQEVIEPERYKHILEKKELEEYRKNNQATSNAYKCKKCGETKCQVTQKQTRSGDEPATTFVNCMECGFLFKF
jgi:DNA-directed RNA polymerase subunit M/transcription elongation factor TFIIS